MSPKPVPGIGEEEMDRIRRQAMDFSGIGLYRYRLDGTVVFMDRGTLRILDLEEQFPDPSELVGRNVSSLLVYKLPVGSLRRMILEEKHVRDLQYPFRTLSGKDRWALHDSYLVTDRATGEQMVQVIVRDVTEIRRAQADLDAERERLAVTLRSIGDGVITTGPDGRVQLLNRQAELLTGWTQEEARGLPLGRVFPLIDEQTRKPLANPVERVLAGGGSPERLSGQALLVARDRRERRVADSAAPIVDQEGRLIGGVLVFRDITRLLEARREREKIARLESLGLLAGGIAHDFNNILTAVLGNISLARLETQEGGDGAVAFLEEAEMATALARKLTQQLLTFSKGGAPARERVSPETLLPDTVNFVLRGSAVEPVFDLAGDLWQLEADPAQLGQVVTNIVLNAKQAMPEGGRLVVSADNLEAPGPAYPLLAPEKRYVRIRFRDEGTGIDERHLPRIFDPYFTTKQDGTGLGLASAFSIVRRHDGHIQADSSPGAGTTFTVFLPASERGPAPAPAPATAVAGGRQGRILVMDDEKTVRGVCAAMLRNLGYQPVCVENGEAAIREFEASRAAGRAFDAVILDLTVRGGMGGVAAMERLRELDPEVVAIVSSGYSTDGAITDHASHGFRGFVSKPYAFEDLARVLASVLP